MPISSLLPGSSSWAEFGTRERYMDLIEGLVRNMSPLFLTSLCTLMLAL